MTMKCAPFLLIAVPLSALLFAASAGAACSDRDRPGTPEAVKGEATAPTSIRISFRANSIYWDVVAREESASGKVIQNYTGVTRPSSAGKRVVFDFRGLREKTTYCFEIRMRTLSGSEGCTSKMPASVCVETPADTKGSRLCNAYAKAAIDTVNLVRNVYKCDPKLISGPRWSASSDEHMKWCAAVSPAARKAETDARTKTMHECRVAKHKPTPTLAVTWQAGNVFKVVGRNFLPNTPITIDVSGPPTTREPITSVGGSPIVSNAIGNFALTLSGVCNSPLNRGAVAFTARDQDGNRTKTVTADCKGSIDYTPNRKIKP